MRDGFADLVIVDAFAGARVPAELTTVEFLTDLRRVVGPTGAVVINVTDSGGLAYSRRVLAGVAEVFTHVVYGAEPATLKGRRFGNVIITGSDAPLPEQALIRRGAGSMFPYRLMTGGQIRRFIGSATAVHRRRRRGLARSGDRRRPLRLTGVTRRTGAAPVGRGSPAIAGGPRYGPPPRAAAAGRPRGGG